MTVIITFQPLGISVDIESGTTILEAARAAGIGLSSVCGGQMKCGTCLVRIREKASVNPPTEVENEKLGHDRLAEGYRLACRTVASGNLTIDIPRESLTSEQRSQVEGLEKTVTFDPVLQITDLVVPEEKKLNTGDDWRRVIQAWKKTIDVAPPLPESLQALQHLPSVLRANAGQIRLVSRENRLVDVCHTERPVLGMAVDIGTTKVAGYLLEMETGKTLSQTGAQNPQIAFGEDVMARITYAMQQPEGIRELQKVMTAAINAMAIDLCHQAGKREATTDSHQDVDPEWILEIVMVGNTAMHHILLGLPVRQLGLSPYVPVVVQHLDVPATDIGLQAMRNAVVHLLPNIAGFVGADHVAMLLAADVENERQNTLYMDIGTNTELTLKIDNRLVACSTASGPAFEGAHISDGMRAAEGAIEHVRIDDGQVHFQTIGNTRPIGICGSGIVDAVAQMLRAGIINRSGSFDKQHPLVAPGPEGPALVLASALETGRNRDIRIGRRDISEIQLAKGAIRAGIELLLQETGTPIEAVEQVLIAGAFGTYLNIESAGAIGLLPAGRSLRISQIGNAAGIGAKMALLSKTKREAAQHIGQRVQHIELAGRPDFTALFTKAMYFE